MIKNNTVLYITSNNNNGKLIQSGIFLILTGSRNKKYGKYKTSQILRSSKKTLSNNSLLIFSQENL